MPRQSISLACAQCGALFQTHPCQAGKRRFCSRACGLKSRARPFEDRFWEKVQVSDGCWLWQGARNQQGYGLFVIRDNITRAAHKLSFELTNSVTVPAGMVVMHRCDNPPCCNPDHLQMGTPLENSQDCTSKGRQRQLKGEAHPSAKLTAAQIAAIRREYTESPGERMSLAHRYGVSWTHIKRVVAGESWRHID